MSENQWITEKQKQKVRLTRTQSDRLSVIAKDLDNLKLERKHIKDGKKVGEVKVGETYVDFVNADHGMKLGVCDFLINYLTQKAYDIGVEIVPENIPDNPETDEDTDGN